MDISDFHYKQYYCEENVWHLCHEPILKNFNRKVVFISNKKKACRLWDQRTAILPAEPIWLDYHVILLCYQIKWAAWDLDTLIGFPVGAEEYLLKTFRGYKELPSDYQPLFRVIDAKEFVENFSSDRSHMLNSSGKWIAPPPAWAPIMLDQNVTFQRFVDMDSEWIGEVLTIDDMHVKLGLKQDA